MGYYDLVLSKDEQAAYDYAMESARIIIPANTHRPLECWPRLRRGRLYQNALTRQSRGLGIPIRS